MTIKLYEVGGAVRDSLLGLPVKDKDYVVVGSNAEEMHKRGFISIGKDFPVFLHPESKDEYALARIERKVSKGYSGFKFDVSSKVTLRQDLYRRDLTINAIARDSEGKIYDPYNGIIDLKKKIFRHVSSSFIEDPLRILRVARFAARFTDFKVADETEELMKKIVKSGEIDSLIPERIWKEISRGLSEKKPSRMFEVLRNCGAILKIFPDFKLFFANTENKNYYQMIRAIDICASNKKSLAIIFVTLVNYLLIQKKIIEKQKEFISFDIKLFCKRLKVPNNIIDFAILVSRELIEKNDFSDSPEKILSLFDRCDVYRKPERFKEFLTVCRFYEEENFFPSKIFFNLHLIEMTLQIVLSLDEGEIAKKVMKELPSNNTKKISVEIFNARYKLISNFLKNK
tara:strand:+ start:1110 stop:2306 length:1197 start_codon:yes stop_codon:yes gene_type:complete